MSRAGLPARDERDEPSREISPADSVGTSSRTVSHGARVLDASRPERRARRREKNANRTRAWRGTAEDMTTTVVHAATTVEALIRDDEAKAMDVDEPHVDSVSEEIILATYRKDAVTVAECLKRCTPETTAEMSLSRAAAVQLLGEDVYLGSHSWSTQEGFPVMYFAGANPGFRRRAVHAPAPPSRGAGRETCRVFVFSRERNRLLPSHRASNRWSRPLSRPDETYRAGSYPNEHATVAPTTRYPEDGPSRRCDTPSRAPPRGPAPRPPREKTPHMVFSRGSWNPAWTRHFATSKFRGRSSLRSPTPVGGASDDAPRPLPPSFSRPARLPPSLTDPSLSAPLSLPQRPVPRPLTIASS